MVDPTRGQRTTVEISWPPVGNSDGRQREIRVPPTGRIPWAPTAVAGAQLRELVAPAKDPSSLNTASTLWAAAAVRRTLMPVRSGLEPAPVRRSVSAFGAGRVWDLPGRLWGDRLARYVEGHHVGGRGQ